MTPMAKEGSWCTNGPVPAVREGNWCTNGRVGVRRCR
jgi:hypothetical protein